jgi:hypothetical protein
MARWRREHPESAKAAERRRMDDRRAEEVRARAYVASYLRRGRIVPPTTCDRCGRRAEVLPYHPDPGQRRVLLWLCESDRRAVPAANYAVVPHWTWPGHIEPLPTAPRWERFRADEARVSAALAASAALSGVSPVVGREMFAAAFFRRVEPVERRSLFGAGLRAIRDRRIEQWRPYGDARVDDLLRPWIAEEHRRWQRERAAAAPAFETDEDRVAERAIRPKRPARTRRVTGEKKHLDAIGTVPRPPSAAPRTPASAGRIEPLTDELLERYDAELAAFDVRLAEIMARVDSAAPRVRPVPDEEPVD